MPARPMLRSPHKRISGWSKGYQPTFGPTHGANTGGHSGDTPMGKKKKMARFKSQPPGLPQGIHVDDATAKRIGLKACFCGKCYAINNGREGLVYG